MAHQRYISVTPPQLVATKAI